MNFNVALTLSNRISKAKLLALLAGAVSLTLSVATIPAVFAQSTMPPKPDRLHRQNWLNLTPEQQEQMQRIKQSQQEQMDNILTADQKARLQSARENRENPRQVFESLNLTDEQKAQMQEVHRSSKQQMDSILTTEQRQQLQQRRPRRPEGT